MKLVRRASLVIAAILLAPIVAAGQAPPRTQAPQEDEFLKGTVAEGAQDLTAPVLKRSVPAKYTPDAMRAKIQGTVEVQLVVMPDGRVDRARVLKSLDKEFGLDNAALAAAKQWTFEPGLLKGEKVAVAVSVTVQFRLH